MYINQGTKQHVDEKCPHTKPTLAWTRACPKEYPLVGNYEAFVANWKPPLVISKDITYASTYFIFCNHLHSKFRLGVCGVYVNSYIVDIRVVVKTKPLQGWELIHFKFTPLKLLEQWISFVGLNDLKKVAHTLRECVF